MTDGAGHGGVREDAQRTELRSVTRRLPIEWAEEIEPQLNSLWLVEKTLPAEGLALIYGYPGSAKSFLALDLGMHVALGKDWKGLKAKRGTVVYVAAEGQRGLRNRIVAFKRHHNLCGPVALALIPSPIDLFDRDSDRHALCHAVRAAAQRYDELPALIIIDTISKTLGAGKENTDDLAVYVANCGTIASEFRCCVLLVHHRPKDAESKDPRGHSSLKGGVDTAILVEAGKPRRAKITKQKDDEEGELLLFNLQPIELGSNDDGVPISSCVVVPTLDTFGPTNELGRKIATLSSNYRIVFDQLGETIAVNGIQPPDDIPPDMLGRLVGKVVDLGTFSDRAIGVLRTGSDIQPDSARRTFKRALRSLQAKGIVRVWEDWVWIDY